MKAEYKDIKLPVKVGIRKNMTNVTLKVSDMEIVIHHSGCWQDHQIQNLINEFMEENYERLKIYIENNKYLNEIMLWGEPYELAEGDNYVDHRNKIIYIEDIESTDLLEKIYRVELLTEIWKTKNNYEEMLNVAPDEWRVRKVKRYWGQLTQNCKTKRSYITVNLTLVKKPKECLRQTMIHELCHFYDCGHGPEFEELMTKYCPDWREIIERNNL